MRCRLIAEFASNHGGDLTLLKEMIEAAAGAGVDYIKLQAYEMEELSPADPQHAWLAQAAIPPDQWGPVAAVIRAHDVTPMVTVFSPRIGHLVGFWDYKLGHADSWRWEEFPQRDDENWFYSWPWGQTTKAPVSGIHLATIPLYPAPLEALAGVTSLDGYSDHTVGLEACWIMIARGATYVEKHFSLAGKGRHHAWDAGPEEFKQLRAWAETCAVGLHGSGQFERWCAKR